MRLRVLLLTILCCAFYLTALYSKATAAGAADGNQAASSLFSTPESSYLGLPVESVTLPNISAPPDRERLLKLLPQQPNEPLSRDQVRKSIETLYATGRFADIRAEATRSGAGVVLAFLTSPNYFIGDVSVDGTKNRPSANQVVNASKLQLGELFTSEKLSRALDNIQQLLEENGYYRASVTPVEQRHENTQEINVTFHLALGEPARIGMVSFTGASKFSQGQLQDISGMHPADFVSANRVSDALDRLRKKYQKQDRWLVQVSITQKKYLPKSNTVDYTFEIQPGPTVDIETEGFKLSKSVLKRNVPVFEENALDDDLLNEGRRNLLNYMQSRGYFEATVQLRKFGMRSGHMRVVYRINPGPVHKLAGVTFRGNKYFPTDTLRALLQIQPAGRVFSRGRYSQKLLNSDLASIESLYKSNGFQDAKVTSKVADNYQGQENQIEVEIHIDEGKQTLVHEFHVVGDNSIPEDQLPVLNTAAGQPFSDASIASDRDILLNFYYNHGFPDVTFEATGKQVSPDEVDVIFHIHEGKQVFVNRVLVSGLKYTRPSVVNRELQMHSGDPLSQIAMLRTQQNLYDLGIFSQVDTAVQNPNGDEREKNVLVQLEEAKRYTFTYGGGFEFQTGLPQGGSQGNTGVSPMVSFGVTRINFRGRGHTITFKTDLGSLEQRVLLSSDLPRWFNSDNWNLTLTGLYDNTVEVSTFTSQRLEGSLQAQERISTPSTMIYSFTFRRIKSSNIKADPAQVPLLSFPVLVGMPGITYIRNTRDNDLETTKGTYSSIDLGVASDYFGSETNFSRIHLQNSSYYAFGKNRPQERKFVFARSTQIGVENPFGNTVNLEPGETVSGNQQPIPLPERFLLGGGNSHRGFGLNQAGPRDPLTGYPLGGSALFLNNLELRFPPMNLPFFQDNLSFAIFHDAGNVFTNGRDMLNSLLQWTQPDPGNCKAESTADKCNYNYISQAIGLGIRYKTPIGPIRFDFAYNLNPPRYPSCQTDSNNTCVTFEPQQVRHFNVFFSIGQTF